MALRIDAKASGEEQVQLRLRYSEGTQIRWLFSLGIRVPATAWNNAAQSVRPQHPQATVLNARISRAVARCNNALAVAKLEARHIQREELAAAVAGQAQARSASVVEGVEAYTTWLERHRDPATLRQRKVVLRHLLEWGGTRLRYDQLTAQSLDEFGYWCIKEHKNTNVTVRKKLRDVKVFLGWARKQGLHQETGWRDHRSTLPVGKDSNPYLTQRELKRLRDFDFGARSEWAHARDLFVFACYTGLRYSDLMQLRWDHIQQGFYLAPGGERRSYRYLDLNMFKTRRDVEVPLLPEALEIVERYRGQARPLPEMTNQALNEAVKEAAEAAGLNGPWREVAYRGTERIETVRAKWAVLTTHCARNTFITLMEAQGMPLTDIQRVVGHANIQTTAAYVRSDKQKRAAAMLHLSAAS